MIGSLESKSFIGVGAVLLSTACFAATSVLIKTAYRLGLGPMEILAMQSWIASLLLFGFALLFRRDIFKVSLRNLMIIAVQGLIGSLGSSILISYALMYLPASLAIMLLYLYPVLVLTIGVVVWHKKVSKKELSALLLTLTGTTVASGVFLGIKEVSVLGLMFGAASAVTYAIFNLLGEMALKEMSPISAMSFSQWFSSLGLFLFFNNGVVLIPWHRVEIWQVGIAMATIASILPFYLLLVGIQRIGSDKAAIISTFELPMTFLMAAVFLQEYPKVNQWIGGGFVFAGIILLNWRSKREKRIAG